MATQELPKVRLKSFSYTTGLRWDEGKLGMMSSDGKPEIRISSPREFKGEPGHWTPEDLFVGAIEMCQMLTFLALAQKQQLTLVSYKSTARGTLEFVDSQYRFTRVVIMPCVTIEAPGTEAMVQTLMKEAHNRCLVANSVTAVVEVNPSVTVQEATVVGERM